MVSAGHVSGTRGCGSGIVSGAAVVLWTCVCFRGELGFLNCDKICMCVVDKQFELLEFMFNSVYVELQYDEISLHQTDTA